MKINLIIDGNYILNKNVFTLHKYNSLYGELHDSLTRTINNIRSAYHFDNIYFVSDSGVSWRKNVFADYKGQRKKSDDIDWEFVYTAYNEYKEGLPKNITLLEESYIEGDDWIYKIVELSNQKGYSNLIISNDHDIKQLINFSSSPLYLNLMSNEMFNREKVFLPENYQVFMQALTESSQTNDLFNLSDDAEILRFLKRYIELREPNIVNSSESLIIKLIMGDSSDNIKSAYQSLTKTGKSRGIGKAGAKKIYDKYLEEFGAPKLDDPDLFENIADLICEVKKASYSNLHQIKNKLQDNNHLIALNQSPDHIQDEMKKQLKDKF